jgi:hypothetical protein
MPIRYSQGPIVYTTIRGDTSAHLRADLDAVLLACNWKHVGPVSNGWVYLITSPEGLSCRVVVQDRGNFTGPFRTPCITVQFQTADGSQGGFSHNIIYGASLAETKGYEVVANVCQLFMAVPGWSGSNANSLPGLFDTLNWSVAGGIPALPPDSTQACAAAALPTVQQIKQIFWSCGTEYFLASSDFRSSRNAYSSWSWCLNDEIFIQAANQQDPASGMLCLFALTDTSNVDTWYEQPAAVLRYQTADGTPSGVQVTGTPLYIDAMVGWQSGMQGQLWDAFQVTTYETLDSPVTVTDYDASGKPFTVSAVAWNNELPEGLDGGGGTYFSTLYLLTAPISNVPRVQPANVHY